MEIQYSQLKINHLSNTPSTKAAGGRIFNGVFQQGRQGTSQGQEDFELSWYLFFQQLVVHEDTIEVYWARGPIVHLFCSELEVFMISWITSFSG